MTTIPDGPRKGLRRQPTNGSVVRWRPLRIAALASVILAMTLAAGPARAQEEPLIQPGAPVRMSTGAAGQPCTLNFVFRDKSHTYIGAGARCATAIGERATTAEREFGTLVFHVLPALDPSIPPLVASVTHTESMDEFALIRIDASEVYRVSPVVLDVGRPPGGVTTADRTNEGDEMSMTGQGAGYREGPTRHRRGALISDDERGFHLAIPASLGDGGSPVLDADSNAYGVLASSLNVKGPYGTTIERILNLLDDAGFDVDLVTA